MTLLTILAATSEPVTLADLKAQLRLDDTADASQLARLEQMLSDAIAHIEREAGVTLAPTDFEERFDGWPCGRRIVLQAQPARAVDAVVYVDPDGDEQTLDADQWRFVEVGCGGELCLAAGFSAPALADWPGSVRIRYAAGFNDPAATGSDASARLALPRYARQALIRLAATWFVSRADDDQPALPLSVERAIALLQVFR